MQETKSPRLPFLARFFTLFAGLALGGAVAEIGRAHV